MKKIFSYVFILIFLASCSSQKLATPQADSMAKEIASHLKTYSLVEDATVQINGQTATISLALTDYNAHDNILIPLKKQIDTHVKENYTTIKRVAINTAPNLYEKIQGGDEDIPKENNDEIFYNLMPTG